jgi:hypothetical protein
LVYSSILELEAVMFLRNIGDLPLDYTASHPPKGDPFINTLREPPILNTNLVRK